MKPGLKTPLLRSINYVLYLSSCALIGTGALITWKLPPGSRGGRGLRVLELNRHEWGDIHFWIGVVFVAATLLHLWLNWQWLWKIATSKRSIRATLSLALGLVLIFGIYALPVTAT